MAVSDVQSCQLQFMWQFCANMSVCAVMCNMSVCAVMCNMSACEVNMFMSKSQSKDFHV